MFWKQEILELREKLRFNKQQLALAEKHVAQLEEKHSAALLHYSQIELLEKLGAGAFGDVWHGRHGGRDVAVKMPVEIHAQNTLCPDRNARALRTATAPG